MTSSVRPAAIWSSCASPLRFRKGQIVLGPMGLAERVEEKAAGQGATAGFQEQREQPRFLAREVDGAAVRRQQNALARREAPAIKGPALPVLVGDRALFRPHQPI